MKTSVKRAKKIADSLQKGTSQRPKPLTAEELRLRETKDRSANWQRWGPYVSERQWGTVREDYSEGGDCWDYFSHDQARSRAYRWGEDGLLGISDRQCRLCFALALWNGHDPILKERLFGLTGPEGNHGEDVKECYYYLDSTPTHSYMKALYKYPQAEFPYSKLIEENRRRGKGDAEFELLDTGVFDDNRYFDVTAEYAKASPDDILIQITVANRGPETATIHLLPTLWFRNTWSWGCTHEGCEIKPRMQQSDDSSAGPHASREVLVQHATLGRFRFLAQATTGSDRPQLLFTENETNTQQLFGDLDGTPYSKDAFHRYVINQDHAAVNPNNVGTKVAPHYALDIPPGQSVIVKLRLMPEDLVCDEPFGNEFSEVFDARAQEAEEFYDVKIKNSALLSREQRRVARQAFAGLLWSKQFYHYVIQNWIEGDPEQPSPPDSRKHGRNHDWSHLFNRDIISMPDKWEYPWYAAWDLAFHMIPMARVDGEFAKSQLELFLREWYMHPNGQIPAYEFEFSDVNPPVHAWACWRVYKMTGERGQRDRKFLARVFQKLMLNFTWWVNRKDVAGNHLFSGGFLGLDNIGVFDRSKPLPGGGHLEQADGTAWMAFYCATMLSMALELAKEDSTYEDIASKFFEHFVHIADAINRLGDTGLWDEQDGFYYDQLRVDDRTTPLGIRSIVGVIPLFAVEILEQSTIERLPNFTKRMNWFLKYRPELARHIAFCDSSSQTHSHDNHNEHQHGQRHEHRLLAIPSRERLVRTLRYVLDESEFLSDYGVRALSQHHRDHPFVFQADGEELRVEYDPAESSTGLFGGNSNWRGPIWFPINFLLIESLERYHHFYGDQLTVECPVGSGQMMNLKQVARELSSRLSRIFLPDSDRKRACHGDESRYRDDPYWRDLILFYEYFHGDNGRGVGASHQTGWTSLVAELL